MSKVSCASSEKAPMVPLRMARAERLQFGVTNIFCGLLEQSLDVIMKESHEVAFRYFMICKREMIQFVSQIAS